MSAINWILIAAIAPIAALVEYSWLTKKLPLFGAAFVVTILWATAGVIWGDDTDEFGASGFYLLIVGIIVGTFAARLLFRNKEVSARRGGGAIR